VIYSCQTASADAGSPAQKITYSFCKVRTTAKFFFINNPPAGHHHYCICPV
jgi:hypothetical protein